jgi:hypothetical protein
VHLLLSYIYFCENLRENKYLLESLGYFKNFAQKMAETIMLAKNLPKSHVIKIFSQNWSVFHMCLTSFAFLLKKEKKD